MFGVQPLKFGMDTALYVKFEVFAASAIGLIVQIVVSVYFDLQCG